MSEQRWCVIDVKRNKKKGTFLLTMGHDFTNPIGNPVVVSRSVINALAEKLTGRPHCGTKWLTEKQRSIVRTSDNPMVDIKKVLG